MTLTLDEVRKTKFHMARRSGYEVSEVDLFVDRVEASFAQMTEENSMLKQQVDALKQAQANAQREDRREATDRQQTQPQQVAQQPAPAPQPQQAPAPQQQQAPAPRPAAATQQQPTATAGDGVQKIVVTTSAEASPVVVRLVQMASEQSESLITEARAESKKTLDDANQKANQITTDARTKADRVESEARVNAEKMVNDAQGRAADLDRQVAVRRTELFAKLETERDTLKDSVSKLRTFENSYRTNLTSHLRSQIESIEAGVFEPADKPELAQESAGKRQQPQGSQRPTGTSQGGSTAAQTGNTPRLDALLGDNNR
ncbi:DivIVA domain-containing protein [Granulicoccus phenolivorans]|uniref:DivIVA domain-containing protein n=1 Tax=Granulicoccus phenolivorans TaxID=266854 RepID=UPI0004001B2C|nr:DivIVA domain-containing protein [Granulicoccus phenolivorans]